MRFRRTGHPVVLVIQEQEPAHSVDHDVEIAAGGGRINVGRHLRDAPRFVLGKWRLATYQTKSLELIHMALAGGGNLGRRTPLGHAEQIRADTEFSHLTDLVPVSGWKFNDFLRASANTRHSLSLAALRLQKEKVSF